MVGPGQSSQDKWRTIDKWVSVAVVGVLFLSIALANHTYTVKEEKEIPGPTLVQQGSVYGSLYYPRLIDNVLLTWSYDESINITVYSYNPIYIWITDWETAVYSLNNNVAPLASYEYGGATYKLVRGLYTITLGRDMFSTLFGEDPLLELVAIVIGKAPGYERADFTVWTTKTRYELEFREAENPLAALLGLIGTMLIVWSGYEIWHNRPLDSKSKTMPSEPPPPEVPAESQNRTLS